MHREKVIVGREGERQSELGLAIHRPWLIISLIILSWAIFIYTLYKNDCPSITPRHQCLLCDSLGRLSFQPLQQNPQFGPAGATLADLGGLKLNFKMNQTNKWHILSSIFFHAGIADLILDTISLLFMGMKLEKSFGTVKIGLLYFLSGLGGSLWASLKLKESVYVGGSSGVCGLTGGAFAELLINLNMHEEKFKRFFSVCVGAAINFTIILFRGADVTANVGGIYMGFLFGFLILIRHQLEGTSYKCSTFDPQQLVLNYTQYQRVLWVIALFCTVIQYLYSLIMFILL